MAVCVGVRAPVGAAIHEPIICGLIHVVEIPDAAEGRDGRDSLAANVIRALRAFVCPIAEGFVHFVVLEVAATTFDVKAMIPKREEEVVVV